MVNQYGCRSVRRSHSSRWSRIVRCLLVIAAWQAPLPFWHNHGTLAHATADTASWLVQHLRTHHPAIDPVCHFVFGWHCHFADPQSGDESPGAPKPNRLLLVVETDLGSWDGLSRLPAPRACHADHGVLTVSGVASATHARIALRRLGGFFTDFAPDLPLPVRLGALRC